eukprot:c15170_g1_i1.p1 GENE.c15170_g1_i1~~c15170_g1_i1.p1  ORF type:complete len:514 (+),score=207.93 c15170_g1_i1:47-1543(+)
MQKISFSELSKHNTRTDCWVAINGKVYNLTSFLDEHPAGAEIILKQAGKDGTQAFEPFHASDIIQTLGKEHLLVGTLDETSVPPNKKVEATQHQESSNTSITTTTKVKVPSLEEMFNTHDFEDTARLLMPTAGWAYYSSGCDDEVTIRENNDVFARVWLRPRVLRNVSSINMKTKIFNFQSSFPLYISATALGKFAHPDGELALIRGAYNENIIYMVPTLGSYSIEEITNQRKNDQVLFFQLYVNSDRVAAKKLIERAERGGCKVLMVTVDAPFLGRRWKDMRNKFGTDAPKELKQVKNKAQGAAQALTSFIDPSLNWEDLKWIKSVTKLPIVLKGVQCGEDAVLAYRAGLKGIILSNHGGRQLDYSRSALEVLIEVTDALKKINASTKDFEILIDGGIRRGSDIFKAIALGAKAVGIGRPTLYGLACHGQDGVERVIQILKNELSTCMALMGTPTIADINPNSVIIRNISDHISNVPTNMLSANTYRAIQTASQSKL